MKCVMIVNENLPRGIIANTTAALGISIASLQDGMTGKNLWIEMVEFMKASRMYLSLFLPCLLMT